MAFIRSRLRSLFHDIPPAGNYAQTTPGTLSGERQTLISIIEMSNHLY